VRPVLTALAAALACALAAPAAHAQRQRSPDPGPLVERPNVVVIMTDDQNVDDLRTMPRTRRAFLRHGVTFERSYVSYPACCPARATYLTGRYAHNHGVWGLYPPTGGYSRFDDRDALPVWLERAGYRTVHVGKYLNGYGIDRPAIVPEGWTEWYGAVDPTTYRTYGYTLNENGRLVTYGSPLVEDASSYQTDVLRNKALDAIRRASASPQPFFLSLTPLAPHHEERNLWGRIGTTLRPAPRHRGAFASLPLPRPPGFGERALADKPRFLQRFAPLDATAIAGIEAEFRARRESLLAVDEAVAAIVRELRARGLLDETYLLFTSDNGFMLGEHSVPRGKMLAYDPSSQVPLLIRGPGIPASYASLEPVVNADLAPTILELTGARGVAPIDGRSLVRFARDPSRRSDRMLLHETGGLRATSPQPEDDTGAVPLRTIRTYRAVRDERWLYVVYGGGGRELYDLLVDPFQLRSRHRDPRYAATRRVLAGELKRLSTCRGRVCRLAGPPVPDPLGIDDRASARSAAGAGARRAPRR
jgi:arylsulfatase A-like enzyme